MINDKASKINKRNRLWFILSFISSLLFVVASLICNYTLSALSFLCSLLIPFLFIINLFFAFYWLFKFNKNICIPLLSLGCYLLFFSAPFQLNGSPEKDESKAFSFMTFNARGFGSTPDIRNIENSKKIFDFVKSKKPDVLCFQEFSKFEFHTFSFYPYKFVGYRFNFEKTLQVIYSKSPIVNKGYVDFPNTRNQTIYADIKFENEIIRVYNIHLQSYLLRLSKSHINFKGLGMVAHKVDNAQSKQEEQVQIILEHAKTFKGKVIFSGDFNSTQYSENYKYLKNNKEDSFVKAGFGLGATYPLFNYPFRIDYILVDKGIEVLSHQNFDLKISDHEPILTKLVLN